MLEYHNGTWAHFDEAEALKPCATCGGAPYAQEYLEEGCETGRILCSNCGHEAQSRTQWNAEAITNPWHPNFVCDTNERVQATVKLAQQVAGFERFVGTHAHIVVDDWNVDDEDIKSCLDHLPGNFFKLTPEQIAAERAYLEAMLALSFNERISVCAIESELFSTEGVAMFEQ